LKLGHWKVSNSIDISLDPILAEFISGLFPVLCKCAETSKSTQVRYVCCCAMKTSIVVHTKYIKPFEELVVNTLITCMSRKPRDLSTDSASAALGTVIETLKSTSLLCNQDLEHIETQWLNYLPLRFDKNLARNTIEQLLRRFNLTSFFTDRNTRDIQGNNLAMIRILLDTANTDIISADLLENIADILRLVYTRCKQDHIALESIYNGSKDRKEKLELIASGDLSNFLVGEGKELIASPGPHAPIHDVLLGKFKT
jgi:hypothetical protein